MGDVPEIVRAGRGLAADRGAASLTFTTDFADADGFEFFIANGSLQYVETPFAESLQGLARRPDHLLINKVPLYGGAPFITLENTVHSYNPYSVGNRTAFIDSVVLLGYSLVDARENPDVTCRIPLHRDRSIAAYSGFYFRANSVKIRRISPAILGIETSKMSV